jgi:hypothetical protein
MAVKTIPAQTIKTCDCCDKVMDGRTARMDGGLTLKSHALDMQGSPCADATRKLDLCDSCVYVVTKAVDEAISAQRAAQTAKQGEKP